MAPKNKPSPIALVQCVRGLLCSLSSIDQERNNISLFNVIEQISLPKEVFEKQTKEGKPILVALEHEIILFLRRTVNVSGLNDELLTDFKVKVIDPEGNVLQEIVNTINFPKEKKRLRFRIRLNVAVITKPGDYQYNVEIMKNDNKTFEKACEIPFDVQMLKKN